MNAYFICLANSYKRGGRCIAGVEISISTDDHWSVVRNTDGSPRWVRPIAKDTEFGEIPEGEAQYIQLFSIVELTEVTSCPQEAHSEDVNYLRMHAIGFVSPHSIVLDELTDRVHSAVFYTTDFSISPEVYAQGDYSLMMIHPEGFEFHLDPTKERAKYRMSFSYNNVIYDMPITDPMFYQYIEQHPDDWQELPDVYLSLSIGMEYEGRHHKLIAAVIIPSNPTTAKDLFAIRRSTLLEKASRRFTLSERLACRRAFVVPSQQGLSVYMKAWSGKEKFIMLEPESPISAWQKINLRKVLLVTYEDTQGKDVYRIRVVRMP